MMNNSESEGRRKLASKSGQHGSKHSRNWGVQSFAG